MKLEFQLEKDLVQSFVEQLELETNQILVNELNVRHGNIDIVLIKNTRTIFTKEQIDSLAKPSCALVFTKIKNRRPITFKSLSTNVGLSDSTLRNVLYELQQKELIIKEGDYFYRKSEFVFPKTTVIGYEAKLSDFNKAFYQAISNKKYVDYSYIVFPFNIAQRIAGTNSGLLQENQIGLIGVTKDSHKILLKAKRSDDMSDAVRLLSLAKAQKLTLRG